MRTAVVALAVALAGCGPIVDRVAVEQAVDHNLARDPSFASAICGHAVVSYEIVAAPAQRGRYPSATMTGRIVRRSGPDRCDERGQCWLD